MGNKEDWDEIEASVRKAEQKRLELHKGIDYAETTSKINKKSKNKIFSKATKKFLRLIIITFFIIAILYFL